MKNNNKNQAEPLPCRAVSCLITRNKGVPVSRALTSSKTSALAAEEALLGFGVMGATEYGRVFARIGIYTFDGKGNPVFKFPVDFDMEQGTPILRPERGGRTRLSEAELALINWIQGGLFDQSIQDGAYFMKLDGINDSVTPPTQENIQARQTLLNAFPQRRDFAADRRLESSLELFHDFLERQDGIEIGSIPVPVSRTPLLSPDQVSEPEQYPQIQRITISKQLFRSLAINRFSQGLKFQTEEARRLKTQYIRALDTADKQLQSRTPLHVMLATMNAQNDALLAGVKKHLTQPTEAKFNMDEAVRSLTLALNAVKTYFQYRLEDGGVQMFAPVDEVDEALFANPMFTAVSGVPMQITSSYLSNGEFPFKGNELFQAPGTEPASEPPVGDPEPAEQSIGEVVAEAVSEAVGVQFQVDTAESVEEKLVKQHIAQLTLQVS